MSKGKKKQLSEREKLARDLSEWIELQAMPVGSPAWAAAVRRLTMRKLELTPQDVKRRNERWHALGCPAYESPVWQEELARLRTKPRAIRAEPEDAAALFWRYQLLLALRVAGKTDKLIATPGQSHYKQSLEQRAEARRMYRWLWRNFPGLLRACDGDLRKRLREAGGAA